MRADPSVIILGISLSFLCFLCLNSFGGHEAEVEDYYYYYYYYYQNTSSFKFGGVSPAVGLFFFCFDSCIYSPLCGARRAMAAAVGLSLPYPSKSTAYAFGRSTV